MTVRDLVVLVVVGLCVWLIDTYAIPDGMFRTVFRVVVTLALVLWLLTMLGVIDTRIL